MNKANQSTINKAIKTLHDMSIKTAIPNKSLLPENFPGEKFIEYIKAEDYLLARVLLNTEIEKIKLIKAEDTQKQLAYMSDLDSYLYNLLLHEQQNKANPSSNEKNEIIDTTPQLKLMPTINERGCNAISFFKQHKIAIGLAVMPAVICSVKLSTPIHLLVIGILGKAITAGICTFGFPIACVVLAAILCITAHSCITNKNNNIDGASYQANNNYQ